MSQPGRAGGHAPGNCLPGEPAESLDELTPVVRRREELRSRLSVVRDRVARACQQAGRHTEDVTLIAVTKYFPASDLVALRELGVGDVGENRDQEAARKIAELSQPNRDAIRVHFIGQVQTNKAGSVARYADVIHSVDRLRLVTALERGAREAGRTLDVLLQVGLDTQGQRGGASEDDLPQLAEAVGDSSALRLRGLMAVAPVGHAPQPAFARLATLAENLRRDFPGATWLSAGMSGDLEAAISSGATHLRVGSAILGSRPQLG